MSMEQREQAEQREVPTGASEASEQEQAKQEQTTPTEADKQAPQDAHQLVMDVAVQIGEDPGKLVKRQDVSLVLEQMKDGVVVQLRISRPRMWARLTPDLLGVSARDGGVSEGAEAVIATYFQLGRRSLLPKDMQERLAKAEANARYTLERYSFPSHWGAFVPLTTYPLWKQANERLEAEFWAIKEELLASYDAIVERVVEDHRPLAEDIWRRTTLSTALQAEHAGMTSKVVRELTDRLRAGEGKETFVTNYLATVRLAMPDKRAVADGFSYQVERSVIPLPSLLARDSEQADRIYRERAIRDAQTQAELEAIEMRRRAEEQKLSAEQMLEQEERRRKLQQERERQRLQEQMERDVVQDARRQKERLVQEFYTGVAGRINTLIADVTANVLESLDEHGGILPGRVSTQLTNLVTQLEHLNFTQDQQVERQLERLRSVLPSDAERERAAKGLGRIDTKRIEPVVRALSREAEQVLIELGVEPRARRKRAEGLAPVNLDGARRRRARSEPQEQEQDPQAGQKEPVDIRRRGRRTL